MTSSTTPRPPVHLVVEGAALAPEDLRLLVAEALAARGGGQVRLAAAASGAAEPVNRRAPVPVVLATGRDVNRRIDALEAEVERSRALHLRVAALRDVVTELLLPAEQQDGELTAKALRDYRKEGL